MQADQQTSSTFILTADIGGSHITAGICNMDTATIIAESINRVEVASKGSADNILSLWRSALQHVLDQGIASVSGLSIAMPGPFDYQNGVSYIRGLNKYEAIYGMDIRAYLAEGLNIHPASIKFRNDAESTIAGEVLAGAGKNYSSLIGVTLGTGFGSAYSENKVTEDLDLGSEPYRDSIADDHFSTRWFMKRYHQLTGKTLIGGVKELAALADNDTVCRNIFIEFADNMSDFLSKPIKQLQPEALILCGNIAKASALFFPRLSDNLGAITIQLAQLGENAPLIGAAATFETSKKKPNN